MKTFFVSFIGLILMFSCQSAKTDTPCIDPSKINDGMCTMQYDPVCGCDGKTYGNPCVASKAGVTSFVKGKCDEETDVY